MIKCEQCGVLLKFCSCCDCDRPKIILRADTILSTAL